MLTLSFVFALLQGLGALGQDPSEPQVLLSSLALVPGEIEVPPQLSSVYRNQGDEAPVRYTTTGAVRGLGSRSTRHNTSYNAWLGMPYAEPPVGNLRFQPPVPKANWTGEWDASKEGLSCLGLDSKQPAGEDCLYVNVFTPQEASQPAVIPCQPAVIPCQPAVIPSQPAVIPCQPAVIPCQPAVMVWIYGGAFLSGSSNTLVFGPDFFMDQNVCLVTFNYRVGTMGFLSLNNHLIRGNMGLKDQALSLAWIKNNMANFGCDPNNITIFGESAGSASVHYQLLNLKNDGLFHRAIMQSGTAITPWAFRHQDEVLHKAKALARQVGCKVDGMEELYLCLMNADAKALTDKQERALSIQDLLELKIFSFLPTTETPHDGAFITEHPQLLLDRGQILKVPVLMGSNSLEALLIYGALRTYDPLGLATAAVGEDLPIFAPSDLPNNVWHYPYLQTKLKDFYMNFLPVTVWNRDPKLLRLITDAQFYLSIAKAAKLMSDSGQKVYFYHMTYDGGYPLMKVNTNITDTKGVCHADELGYLFNVGVLEHKYYNHQDQSSSDELFIDRITTLWANFAKCGDPVPETSPLLPTMWPTFNQQHSYMELGAQLETGTIDQFKQLEFWNSIYHHLKDEEPYPQ